MADPYQVKVRRARLRLAGIGIATVAVLAVGATLAVTMLDDDTSGRAAGKTSPGPTSSASSAPPSVKEFTPATAARIRLLKPTSNTGGVIGTGFEHSGLGVTSAAVSYWEELDLLDDVLAEKQWTAIASKDSPATIDQGVSEVRKVREGVGLTPSGSTPDGITFTTSVRAALARSLDSTGDVVNVWLYFDRYATIRDKGADNNPLRDQTTDLILTWEDGDWKVTTDPKYTAKVKGPHAYDPNSKYAWADGWRQVADE
ncbi:hypothetical protein ACIQOU_28575 [Streptomyces sp. NPDC091279]|uniref:hypothetical protein n=1 Tax=unclassified Streptomyces TaxID=2593676 RepID=UPI00381F85D6